MTGLKIIDGTPTAISKYLREDELKQKARATIEHIKQPHFINKQNNKENTICKCGHDFNFHNILDNYACHDIYCNCNGFIAQNNKEIEEETINRIAKTIDPDNTFLDECEEVVNERFGKNEIEKTITMKEHIEILSKQQDYQFAEGFKQGMREKQLKLEEKNKNIQKENEIDAYIENLYQAYGSGTGVLFGIPSNLRDSVRAIVKLTIQSKQKDVDMLIQGQENLEKEKNELAEKIIDLTKQFQDYKKDVLRIIEEELKKYEHCKDTCESQEYDVILNLKQRLEQK